jgi:hypothetical protein
MTQMSVWLATFRKLGFLYRRPLPCSEISGAIREDIMPDDNTLSRCAISADPPAAVFTTPAAMRDAASGEDPVLAKLKAHVAVYDEIADNPDLGDEEIGAALRRHDETLASLLDTMPTTVVGLAAVLAHLAMPDLCAPGEPSLLIAACTTAMDKELSAAAESYLSRLSAAVAAMATPTQS